MKFEEALIDLKKGRKIKMISWDTKEFIYIDDKNNLRDENKELIGVCPTWLFENWQVVVDICPPLGLGSLTPFPNVTPELTIYDLMLKINDLEEKAKSMKKEYDKRLDTLELKHWVGIGRYYP